MEIEENGAPTSLPPVPEAAVAGDWGVVGLIAAAIAGLLLWRRRQRRP